MKKKTLVAFSGVVFMGFLLASCQSNTAQDAGNPNKQDASGAAGILVTDPAKDAEDDKIEITGAFSLTDEAGTLVSPIDNVYTLSQSGIYVAAGCLENGQIVVDGDDIEVEIDLNNCKITSSTNSPIFVKNAGEVKVKSLEGTYNEVSDERSAKTEDTEEQGEAAIYSKSDLKIVGKGSLVVKGGYNNGISTTDDLEIKNVTTKVTARNNSIKGNDSVTIESGNIIAISTGGDGIKTSNSDISSKGNQHGNISILGGTIDIYSCCDGIDSALDVTIEDGAVLNIYTDKYSTYSGTISTTTEELYIKTTYSNSSYRLAAYFYNDDEDAGVWVNASYYTSSIQRRPGSSSTSYFYKLDRPTSYTNVKFYIFNLSDTENDSDNAFAKSDGQTVNTSKDLCDIVEVKNGEIEYDWATYTYSNNPSGGSPFGGGPVASGTSTKSEYSSKGIKSDNIITINGGSINIQANDDSIHANGDNVIESTSKNGVGDITINGGYLQLSSADDGIHADNITTINGGTIAVIESYEGIEGSYVYFNGGTSKVIASDDGVNAQNIVSVTGGKLEVTVGQGDVDGIDSNGDYKQTGGYVVSRCGAGDMSGNMAALDIDGTCTITGGTFISVGGVAETPSSDSQNWVIFGSASGNNSMFSGGIGGMAQGAQSGVSFQAGTYTISGTSIEFILTQSYTGVWISSDEFKTGTSYTISGGASFTWTQSSGKTEVN